ncbi:piwi-like protein 1 [Paramacrobiotus metropolitanus]|uniref:piwi-like protein 1 n=1 Tax=Paramacrobiotus metropolitanus TaxID=2943436 RepID=UPI002445E782|nr:piwi-like protein 1 [Paramacrobiotus metropolitanus]
MSRIRDACYDPDKKVQPAGYQGRVEIWPGIETSIGRCEGDELLMQIDQRFLAARKETALDVLRRVMLKHKDDGELLGRTEVAKALIGQVVVTPYNNLTYRVESIDWATAPVSLSTVSGPHGKMTFQQYFVQHYGAAGHITDLQQPLLVSQPANRALRRAGTHEIRLVPELCRMTGYTEQMRSDVRMMQAVARHTKLDPPRRKAATEAFIHRLTTNSNVQQTIHAWDVEYGKELVGVEGRRLRPPQLQQSGKEFSYDAGKAEWGREVRSHPLQQTVTPVRSWLVLVTEQHRANVMGFVRLLLDVAVGMGVHYNQPELGIVTDAVQSYIERVGKDPRVLDLVLAVFATDDEQRYSAFKQFMSCHRGIVSQVVLAKTIRGQPGTLRSVATSLCQQINAKMGGTSWILNFGFESYPMVVGIHCHADHREQKTVVVAAATYNRDLAQYHNADRFVDTDEQAMQSVASLIQECLENFRAKNGAYPADVLLYRGAISDGQLKKLIDTEVSGVRSVIGGLSTNKKIALTYMVVSRNVGTRFFQENGKTVGNPLPGTVVDRVVTRADRRDFFVVAQNVREGTASPTYYHVIVDDAGRKMDDLQLMTYRLCHLYYNWQGPICVPAALMCAKKHSQLIAHNLHQSPATSLRDRMHFL